MSDVKRLRELCLDPSSSYPPGSRESWLYYSAASPSVVLALLDRLEAVERARDELAGLALDFIAPLMTDAARAIEAGDAYERVHELRKAGTP